MISYKFEYNNTIKTWKNIQNIDFTYHINTRDYTTKHTHSDYWEFTLLTEGKLENNNENKKEIIYTNELFISTPEDTHYLKAIKNEKISYVNIIARESAIHKIIDFLFPDLLEYINQGNKKFHLPTNIYDEIYANINKINSLGNDEWETSNAILRITVTNILSYIYLQSLKSTKTNEKWEVELLELENTNEFKTFTVNDLCERLGYSRTQLNRLFQTHFNKTPHQYLLDVKMEYAESLVIYTDITITEISSLLGFANLSQFNNNFKQRFNDTPKNYRINKGNM